MGSPAVVHRAGGNAPAELQAPPEREVESPIPLRIIQTGVSRQRQRRQQFRNREIVGLGSFRRPDAVGAGTQEQRRAAIAFREQEQAGQRADLAGRGIVLHPDLQPPVQPVVQGKPPARALQFRVHVAPGHYPAGMNSAPPERRPFPGSAASGRRGGSGAGGLPGFALPGFLRIAAAANQPEQYKGGNPTEYVHPYPHQAVFLPCNIPESSRIIPQVIYIPKPVAVSSYF